MARLQTGYTRRGRDMRESYGPLDEIVGLIQAFIYPIATTVQILELHMKVNIESERGCFPIFLFCIIYLSDGSLSLGYFSFW